MNYQSLCVSVCVWSFLPPYTERRWELVVLLSSHVGEIEPSPGRKKSSGAVARGGLMTDLQVHFISFYFLFDFTNDDEDGDLVWTFFYSR